MACWVVGKKQQFDLSCTHRHFQERLAVEVKVNPTLFLQNHPHARHYLPVEFSGTCAARVGNLVSQPLAVSIFTSLHANHVLAPLLMQSPFDLLRHFKVETAVGSARLTP